MLGFDLLKVETLIFQSVSNILFVGENCRIVFVDYGNELDIECRRLFPCPSSVSSLPWIAVRVRFHQFLTREEFIRFWHRTDSHWMKMRIVRIHPTHYTVQLFVDYASVLLQQERTLKYRLNNEQCNKKVCVFSFFLSLFQFVFFFFLRSTTRMMFLLYSVNN